MEQTPTKNLYTACFRHIVKPEMDAGIVNVVAANFTEAIKKAEAASSKVSTGEADPVELFQIELAAKIDAE